MILKIFFFDWLCFLFSICDVDKFKVYALVLSVSFSFCTVNYFLINNVYSFSTDEAATENILKAELTMAALCGRLGLVTSRDAFITAICKGSLPPHYALTVLNSTTAALSSKCKHIGFP